MLVVQVPHLAFEASDIVTLPIDDVSHVFYLVTEMIKLVMSVIVIGQPPVVTTNTNATIDHEFIGDVGCIGTDACDVVVARRDVMQGIWDRVIG
ncbi:Hypothetical protein MVR_LOCUS271 [uncultured virus]|nr:Hypothetical protein MVR_LOCUS271 [uncultured virus]